MLIINHARQLNLKNNIDKWIIWGAGLCKKGYLPYFYN
jgi:hypothetical protein